jgi:hypothetical protein
MMNKGVINELWMVKVLINESIMNEFQMSSLLKKKISGGCINEWKRMNEWMLIEWMNKWGRKDKMNKSMMNKKLMNEWMNE